jgi:hypothetical protein
MQSACHNTLQRCPDVVASVLQPRLRHCPPLCTSLFTTQRQQRHCFLASVTQQQQALAVPIPPQGYNYKSVILEETVDVVSQQFPQLMDLVDQGGGQRRAIVHAACLHSVQTSVIPLSAAEVPPEHCRLEMKLRPFMYLALACQGCFNRVWCSGRLCKLPTCPVVRYQLQLQTQLPYVLQATWWCTAALPATGNGV